MSQNPAHTPRRALSPPAVTRFQLRTASATEAVFSPPYLPDPRDFSRPVTPPPPGPVAPEFPEPVIRRQPPALPPGNTPRELPRTEPPTRALELPAVSKSGSVEPARTETDRTEPGTWREIIARFERELGPLTESEQDTPDAPVPTQPASDSEVPDIDVQEREAAKVEAPETEALDTGGPSTQGADTETSDTAVSDIHATDVKTPGAEAPDAEAPNAYGSDAIDAAGADVADQPAAVEPGEPPLLDEPVPWEFEAMTTPDYAPPQSIHDTAHDSWPVEAEAGDAVPAWSQEDTDGDADAFDEIGELLLDEVVPADPWDREPDFDEPASGTEFPLDAFIVPAGVQSVAGYGDDEIARHVARRLDEIARELRDRGLRSLGTTDSVDELSRVLAAIVTGYVSRGA